MPKDMTREQVPLGEIKYQWKVSEYEKYQRGFGWYVAMVLLGIALAAFGLLTGNYLFALIIVLFGIIMYLQHVQEPPEVLFAITETGIVLGRKYYRYTELKDFWILYNPPVVKNLYFTINNVLRHRLQVPLQKYDPRPIREYLAQYLVENVEEEGEPVSDKVARALKLH